MPEKTSQSYFLSLYKDPQTTAAHHSCKLKRSRRKKNYKGKRPKDVEVFTYFIALKSSSNVLNCKYESFIYCMISTSVPEMLWCSCCPEFLPIMLSKCCLCAALYTVKTKGPCVLPRHITINLYDKFLTGDSCRHFWTLVVSFGSLTEYIAPQNFHFI